MLQTPGTIVNYYYDLKHSLMVTVRNAVGNRNDPQADSPSTPVLADLLLDSVEWLPIELQGETWVERTDAGCILYGVSRADSAEAFLRLDAELQTRGFWCPVPATE